MRQLFLEKMMLSEVDPSEASCTLGSRSSINRIPTCFEFKYKHTNIA